MPRFSWSLDRSIIRASQVRSVKWQSLLLPAFFLTRHSALFFSCRAQESDDDSESDGLGADLDEDGDVELRLARLEHLLERRPILVNDQVRTQT